MGQKLVPCSSIAQQHRGNGTPQASSQLCFSFGLPFIRWGQVGDGGLQDEHIALGSELETTQGLGSAPRLMISAPSLPE